MGGIPTMLLMIATAGVTYGWQPDRNGDDAADVEYLVQVSPAELAQLQRSELQKSGSSRPAQISSVIDPQVRGHVSRIVLRVGTGDLPRTLPAGLSNQRVATLKPDPQGGGGFGLPSSLQNSASNAVNGAANQLGNQAIDRAGRAIQNGADQAGQQANNLLDRIRGNTQDARTAGRSLVAPPSTRPGNNPLGNNRANQTSSPNPFAQPRTGGPSTSPTGQNSQTGRDNQWSRFAEQQQQQQQNSRGVDASLASNGLRSSDTFGQMPNALQNPNASQNNGASQNSVLSGRDAGESPFSNRTGREQDSANVAGAIYSQIDQTKRDFQYGLGNNSANNRNTAGTPSTRSGYQQPRSTTSRSTSLDSYADRNQQGNDYQGSTGRNPKLNRDQIAAGGWDFDDYNRLVNRSGQLVRVDDRQPSFADRTGSGTSLNGYADTNNSQQPARLGSPSLNDRGRSNSGMTGNGMSNNGTSYNGTYDRSLANNRTSTQSRDAWGQPIVNQDERDRYLREQDLRDRDRFASNSVTNIVGTRDNLRGTDSRATRYPSTNNADRDSRYQDSRYPSSGSQYADLDEAGQRYAARVPDNRSTTQRPTYDRSAEVRQQGLNRSNNGTDFTPSPSPAPVSQAGFTPTGSLIKPKPVAAQPLFNGLLLISIVANLYLIFWLKNLRVQFKDMVTAKRMASSTASVA